MQSSRRQLSDLEIVAYADVLLPEQLPAILPPIFKLKKCDEVVFPPFHIEGEYVYFDYLGDMTELRHQIARDQATLLHENISALPYHELWIDRKKSIYYQPWDEVEEQHEQQARAYSRIALEAFMKDDFDGAKRNCRVAVNYDDRLVDTYAILAAIAKEEGNEIAISIYAQAVEKFCNVELFTVLVQHYQKQRKGFKNDLSGVSSTKTKNSDRLVQRMRLEALKGTKKRKGFRGFRSNRERS